MASKNLVILIGRLGADPDVKYTPNGTAVANFNIAVSESWKDRDTGEKKEKTDWIRIVAWKRLAELAGEYLQKGSQCCVEGKITTRSWEDQDGNKRYMTKVVARDIQFLDSQKRKTENYTEPIEGDPLF